uniref:Uncharacterized protein n=1 Tax=Elaeophora elaphi TaxID=1147741 RepID=A0A0R3S3H0_9BILA
MNSLEILLQSNRKTKEKISVTQTFKLPKLLDAQFNLSFYIKKTRSKIFWTLAWLYLTTISLFNKIIKIIANDEKDGRKPGSTFHVNGLCCSFGQFKKHETHFSNLDQSQQAEYGCLVSSMEAVKNRTNKHLMRTKFFSSEFFINTFKCMKNMRSYLFPTQINSSTRKSNTELLSEVMHIFLGPILK